MNKQEPTRQLERTIGDYVAEDYRVAKVFENHGIDFCCGGNISVGRACTEKGIDAGRILEEIEAAKRTPLERSLNYNAWELPFLADYIINTHHIYLKENVEKIAAYTRKIAEVHGPNHPELREVAKIFGKAAPELMNHLREEEEVLFPAVRRIDSAVKGGTAPAGKDVETVTASLRQLNREHEEVGEAVHAIRRLTADFSLPDDACNTFRVTYNELQEFEDDLHKHVHLENNILFPKVARVLG